MYTDKHIHLKELSEASAILLDGGVGVLPTDTVYGLVARAYDEAAVKRLYRLKNREHKPGTIIAASTKQLNDLGASETLLNKVKKWWPNPLSIILKISPEFDYLHQGIGDVATRVVANEQLRHLLERTGPLLTSSANHPGKPGAANVDEAWDYFGDSVDFYVDGGDLSDRAPSTIIRIKDNEIEIIRDGAVKITL